MGLRGPKPRQEEPWMREVAELMVNEFMSFSAACQAIGKKFDNSAAERMAEHLPSFRNLLSGLGYRFYAEIGDNPLLTKGVILGWLVKAVERLGQQDQWDKVAIPAKLVSDIMGFTRESTDTPVLINLTQKDIDEARERMRADAAAKSVATVNESEPV